MDKSIEILTSYNRLWSEGIIKKPLNIMIGGNIGTGKSAFALLLTEHLNHINVLPTGIIRSVLQSLNLQDQMPELYGHSYQIGQLINDPKLSDTDKVVLAFNKQLTIVDAAIRKILDFSQSEGQQYIIEGNHVKAQTIAELQERLNLIGIFFQTSDIDQYRKNVGGPTHQRQLTDEQFETVLTLHNFLVSEAKRYQIPVFEYNNQEGALTFIASQIAISIEKTHV